MTEPLVDRVIRRQGWLEPVADVIQKAVGGVYRVLGKPGAALRSALHGTRIFGHPLHPALTDLPVGAWTVGVVADFVAHFSNRIPTEAGDRPWRSALSAHLARYSPATPTSTTLKATNAASPQPTDLR